MEPDKVYNYDMTESYYTDDIREHDLVYKFSDKLINCTLSGEDLEEINEYWTESMACGAQCYYYWMLEDPKLNTKLCNEDSHEGTLEKKRFWNTFVGLDEKVQRIHEEELDDSVEYPKHDDGTLVYPTDAENFHYTFAALECYVLIWGQYYILEAYFPH